MKGVSRLVEDLGGRTRLWFGFVKVVMKEIKDKRSGRSRRVAKRFLSTLLACSVVLWIVRHSATLQQAACEAPQSTYATTIDFRSTLDNIPFLSA